MHKKMEYGLRLKGIKKENDKKNPLITFITVTFNDEDNLKDTIESVIQLKYSNVEFIIIDGVSKDGTLSVIQEFEDFIDYAISEKDNGVYDAMNKGIELASGYWLNFLNAGDKILYLNKKDLVRNHNTFTNYYFDEEKEKILRRPLSKLFLTRNMPCHQSIIYKRDEIVKYSLEHPVIADFEQILRILKKIEKENVKGSSCFFYKIPGISHEYASSKGSKKIKNLINRNNIIRKELGIFYFLIGWLNSIRIIFKSIG